MKELILDPFEMGFSEEDVLEMSQAFISWCKKFKIAMKTPPKEGAKGSNPKPRRVDGWEYFVDREYLDTLLANEKPLATNNFNNLQANSDFYHGSETRQYSKQIAKVIKKYYDDVDVSGEFYYPPTGCMSWHTNADAPCKRIYITYSNTGDSFFRFYNEEADAVVTDWDKAGISFRMFDITNEPPYFWHCVGSNCDRYSLGFRLNQQNINWED